VFTKYDQFFRNVTIDLEDCNDKDPSIDVSKEAKKKAAKEIFEEHYLGPLEEGIPEGIPWVQMRGGFQDHIPRLHANFFRQLWTSKRHAVTVLLR